MKRQRNIHARFAERVNTSDARLEGAVAAGNSLSDAAKSA